MSRYEMNTFKKQIEIMFGAFVKNQKDLTLKDHVYALTSRYCNAIANDYCTASQKEFDRTLIRDALHRF